MSTVYFIASDGETIITLDCVESVDVSKSNSISTSSVMSGNTTSDGYEEGLKKVNINGLVTYSKSVRQQQEGIPNPLEFQDLVDDTIRSHTKFRLYVSKGKHQLLKDIEVCAIDNYSVTATEYLDSIEVSLSISEVFVSQAATTTFLPPVKSPEAAKSTSDTENTKATKTQETKERSRSLALAFEEETLKLFTGG